MLTQTDYTHLAVVVDRSGSMATIKNDMIGALNEFFKSQAELPGKCLVDYVQFDTEYEVVFTDKEVSAAKAQLQPRGGTALNDAFGKTITTFGEKLSKLSEDERPANVIVVVVTDGGENSSREWTVDAVKKAVEHQTDKYNWEFVFLGANMDAVSTGAGYGIGYGNTITYDVANTQSTIASLSNYVGVTRSAGAGAASFSDEDRKNAVAKS